MRATLGCSKLGIKLFCECLVCTGEGKQSAKKKKKNESVQPDSPRMAQKITEIRTVDNEQQQWDSAGQSSRTFSCLITAISPTISTGGSIQLSRSLSWRRCTSGIYNVDCDHGQLERTTFLHEGADQTDGNMRKYEF